MFRQRETMPMPSVDLPAPSPAAIAAAVPRSAELVDTERLIYELRARRDAIRVESTGLYAQRGGPDDRLIDQGVADFAAQCAELETAISGFRPGLQRLREAHGAAVARALAQTRREAARRALAAIAELRDASALLGACRWEVYRVVGGAEMRFPQPDLTHVEIAARREAE